VRSATDWARGEIVGFRLASGLWTVMRVIGHHEDKGGRSPVCELLDWTGSAMPSADEVKRLSVRREAAPRGISQFLFQEPRLKKDKERILRTDISSEPSQPLGGYGRSLLLTPSMRMRAAAWRPDAGNNARSPTEND
jgi:hypothetical protein